MVFEAKNAFYWTEELIDEESIQDKIDRKKLEISQLTKANLKKLRVDILHSNSYLRIRDKNWKIIWKLKDNQVVDFNGERKVVKYKNTQKVFLWINYKKWDKIIKGFISADYVKGDIQIESKKSKSMESIATKIRKLKDKPKEEIWTWNQKETTIESDTKNENSNVFDKKSNNISTIEHLATKSNTIWYIENGKKYIIWENWEAKLVTIDDYTPEFREALKKYPETLKKVENLNLILTALTKKWKDKSFKEWLDKLVNDFNYLNLIESVNKIEKYIKEQYIFINWWDLKEKNIDLSNKLQVLNYIRDELDDYTLINNEIINQEFFNLIKNLSPKEFSKYINEPDSSIIEKIVWKEKAIEITNKVIKKQAEFQKYWNESQDEIIEKNVPWFENLSIEKQKHIKNRLKNTVKNIFMSSYTKSLIMNEYIEKSMTNEIWYIIKGKEYNKDKWNDFIDLYADINWIWAYDFSDKTLDWWKEAMILIATEAAALIAWTLTMWAGAAWVNALVYWIRWYKWIKWMQRSAELANTTLKWASYLKKWAILSTRAARFASMTAIEGSAFYGWYGLTQSVIEGKYMYSWEGLWESLAYIWAFKMLGGLYKSLWMELKADIPLSKQKLKLTSQLTAETATFSALGFYHEWVLFKPGEWSAETIMQAFIMASLFKWMWRKLENLRFKKSWDKVIVEKINTKNWKNLEKTKWISSTPIEFYKHKKTWKIYTKTPNWRLINENWRIVKVKPENLEKIERNESIPKIQKKIDWNFNKAIGTELNKLKTNEIINLAWNKITKIEDSFIKKRFKVEYNWKKYEFWSLKEAKDFINSNIKDNVTKLEIISKTEYKQHNKRLEKLYKKETEIINWYKFTKEWNIKNSKWEIIDFKELPENVKLKAVELTTWIKWLSKNIVKVTDNLNNLIKKLWGQETITTWEVCDTIYSKSIKKWKKFFEAIWSENIIKKLWDLEPQWARKFTEKDRSFLNPAKYLNGLYMLTKLIWKWIINRWPTRTFQNLWESNTKMEVLKTILTWEKTNKEALIAFTIMWALPIWINIHEKWFINALEWETFKDVLLNEHWRWLWPDTLNAINAWFIENWLISEVTNTIRHWGQENTQK